MADGLKLPDLLDLAPDALLMVNESGRIVMLNRQVEALFGYSAAELMDQPVEQLLPESIRALHERHRTDYLAAPRTRPMGIGLELAGRRKNGVAFPVEISLSPAPSTEGAAVICAIRDLTDRRETEAALHVTRDAIRQLYEIVSHAALDLQGKLQALLRLGCQRFGLPLGVVSRVNGDRYEVREAVSSLPEVSVKPGNVFTLDETFCQDTLAAGGPVAFEHAGGSPEWRTHACYHATRLEAYLGTPILVNGEAYGTLNFSSPHPHPRRFQPADTEFLQLIAQWIGMALAHERADEDRAAALAREQAALRSAAALQTLTDVTLAHGSLETLIEALVERIAAVLACEAVVVLLLTEDRQQLIPIAMLGVPTDLLAKRRITIGQNFASRVLLSDAPVIIADRLAEDLTSPLLDGLEVRSLLGVQLRVGGTVIGIIEVADLAPHRFTNEEATLLQLAADRIALAIDRARLFDAMVAAVQLRERVMAAISHDLGQPLATIRGYAQLWRRRLRNSIVVAEGDVEKWLSGIEAATSAMSGMLTELLDSAKLQAGQALDLHTGPVDLTALVQQQVAILAESARRHSIELTVPTQPIAGEWDAPRLARVVANLLSNALKYSPGGAKILVALTTEEDADGAWAALRVSDQGFGIPAEDLPRIFERFFRATNARQIAAGTGIGLSGAKQIVEHHGGTLTLESRLGEGTTVIVRLPLHADTP